MRRESERASPVLLRAEAYAILSSSPADVLSRLRAQAIPAPPTDARWLRAPEYATLLLRGRLDGAGAVHNISEVIVTRCALDLGGKVQGYGYILGRDLTKAADVAWLDAWFQVQPDSILMDLLQMRAAITASRTREADAAATTRVDFRTLMRGDA